MIVTKNTPLNSLIDGEPIYIDKEVSLDKNFLEFLFVNFPNSKVIIKTFDTEFYASIPDALYTEEELSVLVQNADMADKYNRELIFDDGYTLEQAIVASRKLNDYADYINNLKIRNTPLSPLEKFTIAYNIVSSKVYSEDTENPQNSRNIISTLSGDKIVCSGFASELNALCKRIGIPCSYRLNSFGTNQIGNHATCIVNIKDEKYGVDGIYVADPTGDSSPYQNYSNIEFNNFLLTHQEYSQTKPNNKFDLLVGNNPEGRYTRTPIVFLENLYPSDNKSNFPELEFFSSETHSLDFKKIRDAIRESIAKTFPKQLKPATKKIKEEDKTSIESAFENLLYFHLSHTLSGGNRDKLPPLVSNYHNFLNTYLDAEEIFDSLFLSVDNISDDEIMNVYLDNLKFLGKELSQSDLYLQLYCDISKTKPIKNSTLEKLIKNVLSVLTGHDSKTREQLAKQAVHNRHNNIYPNNYGLT